MNVYYYISIWNRCYSLVLGISNPCVDISVMVISASVEAGLCLAIGVGIFLVSLESCGTLCFKGRVSANGVGVINRTSSFTMTMVLSMLYFPEVVSSFFFQTSCQL